MIRFFDKLAITVILALFLAHCTAPAYAQPYYTFTPLHHYGYIEFNDVETAFLQKEWTEINEPDAIDLLAFIKIVYKVTLKTPQEVNQFVNETFEYSSNDFNMWHWQSPIDTFVRETGDCKAKALLKYRLLRQLGYKNIKIMGMDIMTGLGKIEGHAVVVLNDDIVLDINYPYYYPYAYAIQNDAPLYIFDAKGVASVKLPKE